MKAPTFEEAVEGWLDPCHTDEDLQLIVEDLKNLWTDFARETAKVALEKRKTEKC